MKVLLTSWKQTFLCASCFILGSCDSCHIYYKYELQTGKSLLHLLPCDNYKRDVLDSLLDPNFSHLASRICVRLCWQRHQNAAVNSQMSTQQSSKKQGKLHTNFSKRRNQENYAFPNRPGNVDKRALFFPFPHSTKPRLTLPLIGTRCLCWLSWLGLGTRTDVWLGLR